MPSAISGDLGPSAANAFMSSGSKIIGDIAPDSASGTASLPRNNLMPRLVRDLLFPELSIDTCRPPDYFSTSISTSGYCKHSTGGMPQPIWAEVELDPRDFRATG